MLMPTQREILETLVEIYEQKKDLVRGEEIANALNRSSGTIRNQMQTLRALNYVEGVPGPRGGYIPEIKAYEALGLTPVENPAIVSITRDDEKIDGIYAQKIVFKNITDPNMCSAIITVLGDTRKIDDQDEITIGPTPVNHIIVRGKIVGRDDTKRELLIDAHSITSIPKGTVKLKLFKGKASVVGRSSSNSLYDLGLAAYDEKDVFDHKQAEGFVRLWGWSLTLFY